MDDDCQDVLVFPFGMEDMSPLVWKCNQLLVLLLRIFQQCTIHALNFFSFWLLLIQVLCIPPFFFGFPLASSWRACVSFLPLLLSYLLPGLKLTCLILLLASFCEKLQQFFVSTFTSIKISCMESWIFSWPIWTSLSLSPSLKICSSSSSSFRTTDVSPYLEVRCITLLYSEKVGLRYFHQCGSFSSASPLPFLIRLGIVDHSCLNDSDLIFNFVFWSFNILVQFPSIVLIKLYLSFCSLDPEFCSTPSNALLTHSKPSLLEDLFKTSFSKAIA